MNKDTEKQTTHSDNQEGDNQKLAQYSNQSEEHLNKVNDDHALKASEKSKAKKIKS